MSNFANSFIKTKLSKLPKGHLIVTYPGRFQPPTKNHYNVYKVLKETFGVDPIITTSNKQEKKSPFTFQEKKKIWNKMFGVKNVEQIRLPYYPKEVLEKKPEDAIWIVAVGEKDGDRLIKIPDLINIDSASPKDVIPWPEKRTDRCQWAAGMYYVVPLQTDAFKGKMISGTTVRETFANGTDKEKKEMFVLMYGKMDKEIYDLINDRISSLNENEEVDWDELSFFMD